MPDQNDNRKSGMEESGAERAAGARGTEKPMKDLLEIRERLGFGLRSMYRSVLEEPLPADMMALLDQLSESDDNGDRSSKSNPDLRG